MAQKKVNVLYTEDGKAVCPSCFSRPSVDGRVEMDLRRGTKGWSVTLEDGFFVTPYPCSNPECSKILIFSLPAFGQDWERPRLPAAKLLKFATGKIGRDGVWRSATEPIKPTSTKKKRPVIKQVKRKRLSTKAR